MEFEEMTLFQQLLDNRILTASVLAWFTAQVLKVLLTLIIDRKLDWTRLFGLGGMPSSHTSVVVALAIGTGLRMGFNSSMFAITAVLSAITMTDAAGVRRAAGKQAAVLNKVVQDIIAHGGNVPDETLKELLGHTPLQVAMGALLGALIALIVI